MTSSLGNGAHAIAPGFEGARITPEQAEAFAAGFLPSWEMEGAPLVGATNGHATGDLRSTTKSNGVHAESHAPPSRTRVSEPEDSVVIDRSITADAVAAPDSGRVPVATARLAAPPVAAVPVAPPAPPQVAPTPSYRPPPPAPTMTRQMPQRPARPVALAVDDEYPAPKSKKGLFIGLGVGAAALLAIIIGFAASGSDSSKAEETGTPAITVVKPDDSAKAQTTPPSSPPTQTPVATSQPTSTVAAATTPPPSMPVTALPVAPAQDPPKPKPSRQPAAQPPAYTPPPTPRAAPPPRSGSGPIVKDVPF